MLKELFIMDVTPFAIRHWVLKTPPQREIINSEVYRMNQWLLKNFHGLYWCEGGPPYEDLYLLYP